MKRSARGTSSRSCFGFLMVHGLTGGLIQGRWSHSLFSCKAATKIRWGWSSPTPVAIAEPGDTAGTLIYEGFIASRCQHGNGKPEHERLGVRKKKILFCKV